MSRGKAIVLTAALLAAVSVPLLWQHDENTRLRHDLADAQDKANRLDAVEDELKTSRAAVENREQKLQDIQAEVMRLRGEASRTARAEAEAARLKSESRPVQVGSPASAPAGSSSDPLMEFLGAAVQPPPNLDPAYGKEGLLNALQAAAQRAGVTPKKVEIDDSEFPFLLGVLCEKGELEKIRDQFRKMDGYSYGGSVGGDTCAAFTVTPSSAFPSGLNQRISARYMLRMQVLHEKLQAQQ